MKEVGDGCGRMATSTCGIVENREIIKAILQNQVRFKLFPTTMPLRYAVHSFMCRMYYVSCIIIDKYYLINVQNTASTKLFYNIILLLYLGIGELPVQGLKRDIFGSIPSNSSYQIIQIFKI